MLGLVSAIGAIAISSLQAQSVVDSTNSHLLDSLSERVDKIEEELESEEKDIWDKIGVLTPIVSGILVALIGFYATNVYNRRQQIAEQRRKERELAVAQVQTVEKFIPHLSSGSERDKEAALTAIAALGNNDLAIRLALAYGGSGSRSALAKLIDSSLIDITNAASNALSKLFNILKARVVTIHRDSNFSANGFIASKNGMVVTGFCAIDGCTDIKVGFPSGNMLPASVILTDESSDLALLKVQTSDLLPMIEISNISLTPETRVFALLITPEGNLLTKVGKVLEMDDSAEIFMHPEPRNRIMVDMQTEAGSLGTPVVDEDGRLVGIIEAHDQQGIRYLIPAMLINELIRKAWESGSQ